MKAHKHLYISLAVIAIIYITVLLSYFFPVWLGWERAMSWNEIGDSFGMLNALFSALAFAFIIFTSMMQKEELENQRNELELQREELRLTREEMAIGTEAQAQLAKLTLDQLNQESSKRKSDIKPQIAVGQIISDKRDGDVIPVTIQLIIKSNSLSFKNATIENDELIKFNYRYDPFLILNEGESIYFEFEVDIVKDGPRVVYFDIHDKDENPYTFFGIFTLEPNGLIKNFSLGTLFVGDYQTLFG